MHRESADEAERRLDVRDVDGEPFGEITDALEELSADESLLLIQRFEPVPLYDVLERRGFTYETSNPADDEWHVVIERA